MSAAVCVFRRPAPIRRQDAVFDEAMERGIGPVCRTTHPAVLYRIEMDVVDMPLEIGFIADLMFPAAALPDAAFSFGESAGVRGFGAGQLSREKPDLISDQRRAKLASPGGKRQMVCRCSGRTTMARRSNGWACLTDLVTVRSSSMCRTRVSAWRSARFTVKK